MRSTPVLPVLSIACLIGIAGVGWVANAGDLEPPGPPAPTMVTLEEVHDVCEGKDACGVPQTGQAVCWDADGASISCGGTGQDGEYQVGAFALPRFTANLDGTVTDNLTGLIWLQEMDCPGRRSWTEALAAANELDSSVDSCNPNLEDGSVAGDWRLPNLRELQSLIDYGRNSPALPPDHPFFGLGQSATTWTSTSSVSPNRALTVAFSHGWVYERLKDSAFSVWPVRGGLVGDGRRGAAPPRAAARDAGLEQAPATHPVGRVSRAGDLDPPGPPGPTMVTLQQIYDTCTGVGACGIRRTGQTQCWDVDGAPIPCAGTGQDGEYQAGVAVFPRFTDNLDGTVTDHLTALTWLQDASCNGARSWLAALSDASSLADGSCGLTDGSEAGDWRLPNLRELQSLVDLGQSSPSLPPGHPFSGVQLTRYWSSTSFQAHPVFGVPDRAWMVTFHHGIVDLQDKEDAQFVWPVRGGP